MLVDANLLLYAYSPSSPHHEAAAAWLGDRLNGAARVALPWPSLLAFLRLSTNPRSAANPITPDRAWTQIEEWLAADPAWIPTPTARHAEVLGGLIRRYGIGGNAVPDAHLAALAVEHGLALASADTDFARFTELRWVNPVAPA